MTAAPTTASLTQELSDARELIDTLHQTEMRLRDELRQCDVKLSDALVEVEDLRGWKLSAMTAMGEWHPVCTFMGESGELLAGAPFPKFALIWLKDRQRLRDEREQLRRSLSALLIP